MGHVQLELEFLRRELMMHLIDDLQLRVNHNDVNHGAETQSSLDLSGKTKWQSSARSCLPTMEIHHNGQCAEYEVCRATTSVIV